MLEKLLQHSNIGTQYQAVYIIELLTKGSFPLQDLKKCVFPKSILLVIHLTVSYACYNGWKLFKFLM